MEGKEGKEGGREGGGSAIDITLLQPQQAAATPGDPLPNNINTFKTLISTE